MKLFFLYIMVREAAKESESKLGSDTDQLNPKLYSFIVEQLLQ